MNIQEIITRVADVSRRYNVKEVFLYGSRAKGTATDRSDIDLAVSGCRDFEAYKEEIDDIPTLYTIDVLNMENCGNDLLMEDIKQYGRKIY